MDIEIVGELHEITKLVKLPDDAPIITSSRGLRMKAQALSILWVRDQVPPVWEMMGVEVRGKLMTPADKVGTRDANKNYWQGHNQLPDWIRAIVDRVIPETILERGDVING